MRPRLVLIDHDNCLVPTDGKVGLDFYEGLAELWKLLQEWGREIPFGFCTGRDRNYVEEATFVTGLADFPNSWSVMESGCFLFNAQSKEMKLNPALTPQVREAFALIRRERVPAILERFPQLFEYPGNQVQLTFERNYGVTDPIETFYEGAKELLGDLESRGLVAIHHSNIAVDISPMGPDGLPLDKASGVRFLSEVVGIPPAEMLGIGDSEGDFPMLNTVGFVGCPSQAKQECKELVSQRQQRGHPSDFPYSKGVADIIRHFLQV